MSGPDSAVVERLYAKDAMELDLGNTLDVKASLVLVLITFLAAQTQDWLAKGTLGNSERLGQIVAAASLGAALLLAVAGLWLRKYQVELPEQLNVWLAQLREFYGEQSDAETEIEISVLGWQVDRTLERIRVNGKVNTQRTEFISWSFRCTAAALLIDLATLLHLTLAKAPS